MLNASLMPLAYLALRRLHLRRWIAFSAAAVAAQLGQGAGGLARRGQEPFLRLGGLGRARRPVTETARH